MENPNSPEPGSKPVDLKKAKRHSAPEARAVDDIDRLPPHSDEAEQMLLGCIFLQPHECLDECQEKLKAGAASFYDLRNKQIYECLLQMYEKREPIEVITVMQRLRDQNKLESVGGISYLAPLPDMVASAANISFYIQIVREKFILRETVATCTDIISDVYRHEGEVDELLDDVECRLMRLNEDRVQSNTRSMKDHLAGAYDRMEKAAANPEKLPGVPTGFRGFDKLTLGLSRGNVTVVGARPSMGKTSLAYNMASNIAEHEEPTGVISLEMKAEQLVDRHISGRARVDSKRIRQGNITAEEIVRIRKAMAEIDKLPIHIDDERGINILQLRSKMRRMRQKFGCKTFVIDYLQLLFALGKRGGGNRAQEVAEISGGIKSIAGDLDVSVIVLSQLSRELDKGDKPRPPTLPDLRESGAIEQDADEILLLHEPSKRQEATVINDEDDWIDIDGILAKQRNGDKGVVPFRFYRRFTLYVDRPMIDDADVSNSEEHQWRFAN